jgi:hypothetical protein
MSKLQEKPSWIRIRIADPDSDCGSGYGSTALAFDVLPGSVHLVLLLLVLVEGATKTACPIPLFNSFCFPQSYGSGSRVLTTKN